MTKTSINLFKKIALADDDADDVAIFTEALAAVNPSILFEYAPNGRILLEKMQVRGNKPPDIIFLDINMPEMDGWDSLTALKKNSSLKDIPVIMYSTSSMHRDVQAAKKLGANFFYTKPDNFSQLKIFLESLIENPAAYNIKV